LRIAVIGSGGREHALLWRLARDPVPHTLFALPGNGGTGTLAQNVAVDSSDVQALHNAICRIAPDLAVIGPEVPLADGIADLLARDGIACFGPCAAAARVEASKVFSKQLMRDHSIPTAAFEVFRDFDEFECYVRTQPEEDGWVVKADGLAAGKGAYVCTSLDETVAVGRDLLVNRTLGAAGMTVVLERKLKGREVSALYLCDGTRFVALPPAQDYKRAHDHDQGPNTGGMGTYCPAPHYTEALRRDVERIIIAPTLAALEALCAPRRIAESCTPA
jgi:phosphoribosylamine--glycine ligase